MYQGKKGRGGYITVIFHQASNCIARDITNTSDVFAQVGLVDKGTRTIDKSKPIAKTPIIYSTLNPVWHSFQECGPFSQLDADSEVIIELYDVDTFGPDEPMGSVIIPVRDIPESFETTTLALVQDGASAGQLVVEWCNTPIGSDDSVGPDEWLLPRHDRLKWKHFLKLADDCLATANASALALLPAAIIERALMGDEDVLKDLPERKRIVRIFTSSTFTDTKLERNMLMRDVYPYLSQLCRKLGLSFEVVDMRWGVRESTNDSHNTSALCMKELQKCLSNSLGPAFVCFLGEKYGYRPFPAKVQANLMLKMWPFIRQAEIEFAETFMKQHSKIKWNLIRIAVSEAKSPAELWENLGPNKAFVQANDLFLVPTWFRLDMNAPNGGEYVLANITDLIPEFRSNDQATARAASSRWWKIFERMQKDLRDASKQAFKDTHPFGTTYSPTLQREIHFSDRFTISVTHEEVVNGILENKNRDSQSYCFRSCIEGIDDPAWNPNKGKFIDAFGANGVTNVDAEARALLQTLKSSGVPGVLAHQRVFDRSIAPEDLYMGANSDELAKLEAHDSHPTRRAFCDQFCELISNDILESFSKAANNAAMDPIVYEIRQHLFAQRASHATYVTRPIVEKQIMEFVQEESTVEGIKNHQFPLIVLAPSGAGKSTLMAQCALATKKWNPYSMVVSRYIGNTPASTQLASLLRSICLQVFTLYDKATETYKPPKIKQVNESTIEAEESPSKLGAILLQMLTVYPTSARPLYLFIDSLDQLFDPYKLSWVPVRVENPNCRVIVSLLSSSKDFDGIENLESLKSVHPCKDSSSQKWIVEVPPFDISEAKLFLERALKGRALTSDQTKALMNCIQNSPAPTPLFLKMLTEFAAGWGSFTPPTSSTEKLINVKDTKDLVKQQFENLERIHGTMLVSHAMGYLMSSKCGLSGTEMEDLLSCDEDVLSDVYQWWTPPIRRIPPLLWKRIIEDLGSNLGEYAFDNGGNLGPTVYKWHHQLFGEACEERYLPDKATRAKFHDAVANYFEGLYSSPAEIPYMNKSEGKKYLANRMVPPQPLLFNASAYNTRKLTELPYHHLLSSQTKRLLNSLFSFEFIEAKCGAGLITELQQDYKKTIDVFKELQDPLLSTAEQFSEFIVRYSHLLGATSKENKGSLQIHRQALQLALNLPDSSEVYVLAKKQWNENFAHNWKAPLLQQIKSAIRDPCTFTFTHDKSICAIAINNSETRVITCNKLSNVVIWNPKTGAVVHQYTSPKPIWACCITKDDAKCVVGYRASAEPIKIVNFHNGQVIREMKGNHDPYVSFLWISKDERRIVSCGKDALIKVWDAETGDEMAVLAGHKEMINSICIDESETLIFSASDDSTIKVWTFAGELIATLNGHTDKVYSCKLIQEGTKLLSSSKDKTVRIWNAKSYEEIIRFEFPGEVLDCCVSKDGKKLVAVGTDKAVNVRDISTGSVLASYVGHMMIITHCEPLHDGTILTSAQDRTIKKWDISAASNKQVSIAENIFHLGHTRELYFKMPDDKTIETVSLSDNSKLSEIKFHPQKKELVMDFSEDGEILVSIIKPEVLHIWNTKTGEITKQIPIKDEFHALRISKDKRKIIALAKKKLFFIDIATGALEREIEGSSNTIVCNFSQDQKLVATAYFEKAEIRLYDVATGAHIASTFGHTRPPRHVLISDDNTKIITGGPDKTLRISDATTGQELQCLPQIDWVWDVVTSGNYILVSNRVAVCLWDLTTYQMVGFVPTPQFNPSELHLYSESREVVIIGNKELHYYSF